MTGRPDSTETWSGNARFVAAAGGAAIGLGSLWRLPLLAADHGGSAFLAVYLLALLLLGLPLLIAEWLPARRTRLPLLQAYPLLVREAQAAPAWRLLPWLVLAACLLLLGQLALVGGWSLAYLASSAYGAAGGPGPESPARVFAALARAPLPLLLWPALFLAVPLLVSARGLRRGLEPAALLALPLVALGLLWLLLGVAGGHGLAAGLGLLLGFDAGALGWRGVLAALAQAALTLLLAVGAMHAYAARLQPGAALPRLALGVLLLDSGLALLAAAALL
ncbi:MAG TPA: hypothetical protein VIX81_04615, partial [Gammaproteobacteria bacterium]